MNFMQAWKDCKIGEFITNGSCFVAKIKQDETLVHMLDVMQLFNIENVLNTDSFAVLVYKKEGGHE